MHTLAYLLIGHYLADFTQTDYMVSAKSPTTSPVWIHVMSAHCAIQAGTVLLATNRVDLAVCEFVCHFIVDYLKCREIIGFNTDQSIHLFCRLVWWGISCVTHSSF
jgi:hypothetical protein